MRSLVFLLLSLAAVPLFAKWEACPTTCVPPTGTVSGLSSLPLYSVPVRFKEEVKSGGGVFWLWTRVNPPPACTPAQLANRDDAVACAARVGEVLMRTPRARSTGTRLATLSAAAEGPSPSASPQCPLRLPDSMYTDEQRAECAEVLAAMGVETGPRERRAKN